MLSDSLIRFLKIGDKPIDEIAKTDLLLIIKTHEDLGHHDVAHRLCARLQSIFEPG